MADSFNGSYRGEHVDGPLICVRNFTDAGAASRTMPMASLSVYNGVDGYDEVTSTEPLPIVLRDSNGNEPIVPRLTLSDTMSYSTAGIIGATLIGYNNTDSQWNRIQVSDVLGGHMLTMNPSIHENGVTFTGGEHLTLVGFGNGANINTASTGNPFPICLYDSGGGLISILNNTIRTTDASTYTSGTTTPGPVEVTMMGWDNGGNITQVSSSSNLPVNILSNLDIGVGASSAGTLRVALASDSTGPVEANLKIAGSAIAVGNGAVNTETVRVTIADDSTGLVKLASNTGVTVGAVEIAASQSISVYRNDISGNNSFSTTGNAQTFTSVGGYNTALVQISDTWTGTITFQGSIDGSTFFTIPGVSIDGNGTITNSTTANGSWLLNISGLEKVRIYATTISSGTAVVDTHLSIGSYGITLVHPLPTGTNTIGTVNIAAAQTLDTVSTVTNLAQLGGTAIAMNTGTRSSGTQRVTIATDDIVPVVGTVAHDAADSGNSVKVGGKASTTLPTAVSNTGDRVDATFDRHGYQIVRAGHQVVNAWSKQHTPSSNTQATIAQSAAGAGLKNICTSITATLACGSAAPTANQVYLYLRDGTTGSGTILWSAAVSIPATAGSMSGVSISDIWIPGTANTAMTIEFSAAGGANTVETVSMTGIIVAE